MKPRLKSSRAARELIKAHEPFRPEAEPKGKRWVVGYGHTAAAREGVTLSRDDAELILLYDVLQAEQAIDAAVGESLSQNARDALVSFACSIGPRAFRVCDVARLAAAGRHREAAAAMETWVRAQEGGRQVVSERLVRRRAAESALYLRADEAAPAAQAEASEEDAPKLGALVELDIAFEDPAEDPAEDEPAAQPEPQAEPEPEPEPEAGAPEPEPRPERDEDAEAAARDEAKQRQDEVVRSVMARMAAQIADSVERTPPQPRPEPEPAQASAEPPAVSEDARLGYSFLTPWTVAPDEEPASSGVSGEAEAAPQPVTASGPVYASPVASPQPDGEAGEERIEEPGQDTAAEPAPPHPAAAPADAQGVSGEVGGAGRPAEAEPEEEAGADEDEALHPGDLAGPEADISATDRGGDALEPDGRGGDWVFFANLAVGLGLLGAGGWDLATHFETYSDQGFFFFGPVAFAAGLVLTVASAWFLISRFLRRRG